MTAKPIPKSLESIDARRILVIKPSALGDICHALPVLDFLRQRFHKAEIDWVANKSFAPLLKNHSFINEVIEFDRRAAFPIGALLAWVRLIQKLRAGNYDLVLDMQGLLRSAIMARASGCKLRIGPCDGREGSRFFYTIMTEKVEPNTHAVVRNWAFARLLGAKSLPLPGLIKPEAEIINDVDVLLSGYQKPFWVLAPGARWTTKRWPVGHFAEIGNRLVKRYGGSIIVVGAPDEKELTDALAKQLGTSCLGLGGKTGLALLTGLLSVADLVVANDSGPLHLACALGRPVASPFLCTKISLTGPYGQLERAVAAPVACQGSLVRKCPTNQECMPALTPELFWNIIEKSLIGKPPWKVLNG